MEYNAESIALRAQDFHEGLRDLTTNAIIETEFEKTLLIGKAAILAMHLRGILYIDDYTALKYAASQLGIRSLELNAVLRELEEVDFISIVKSGDSIKRIEIKVPEFRPYYGEFGNRLIDLNPTEMELQGLSILDTLISKGPQETSIIQKNCNLTYANMNIVQDIMCSGHLVSNKKFKGSNILFSPLSIDNNSDEFIEWCQKSNGVSTQIIQSLSASQGKPKEFIMQDEIFASHKDILDSGIYNGIIMPVKVNGTTGKQDFLFAPIGGLTNEERVILDKARAIVACVRYGENFSGGTKIKYPIAILERLRDFGSFKNSHPDLKAQYGLLVTNLIGYVVEESYNRYNFRIYENNENKKALNVAIEMLRRGTANQVKIDTNIQQMLLNPNDYKTPITTRAQFASSVNISTEMSDKIIFELANFARGVV